MKTIYYSLGFLFLSPFITWLGLYIYDIWYEVILDGFVESFVYYFCISGILSCWLFALVHSIFYKKSLGLFAILIFLFYPAALLYYFMLRKELK